MATKNILLLCGGGGSEHDISLVSAKYFLEKLKSIEGIKTHYLCIEKDGRRTNLDGEDCELRKAGEIYNRETKKTITLDFAIPCIHGPPGENGQIQAVFELMGLPFLGCGSETSITCFNKVSTKLWLNAFGIPNTPFLFANDITDDTLNKVTQFFREHQKEIFIKASNQGSSIGCYHITDKANIEPSLKKALELSPYVIVEKMIKGRELEVAAFEYQGKIMITPPGEISCPDGFYSYEEKYNVHSKTETIVQAQDIAQKYHDQIQEMALKTFKGLKIKDMARIDFFLDTVDGPLINEINTFPGHTPISMFPMMMENFGVKYEDYLKDRINSSCF